MQFHFGACTFDPDARRLTRDGRKVPLSPKAVALLGQLLARRPSVVTQQELHDHLWPATVVGYNSLAQVVAGLRRALGDRDQRLIRTAYRVGYAFDGEVVEGHTSAQPETERSMHCLRWGNRDLPLREGVNTVGRGPDCECRIASRRVSRQHARIVVHGGDVQLQDLGSKNGTHVRGHRVQDSTPLVDGDVILLGDEAVVFNALATSDTTETAGE